MTEATTEAAPRSGRRSTRPANGNASTDTERPKFEVLADKLYRALMCARAFASEKSKSAEHTVLRFSVADDVISLTAYDGKVLCDLRVPAEACTKPTAFNLQVRLVPTLLRMLAAMHKDEREKTSTSIVVGKKNIEVHVDGTVIRIPYADQLELPGLNVLMPNESREGEVYSATAWGVSPVIAAKLYKASVSVSSSLKESGPRAPDSPIRVDIKEGKAGITGFFVMSPTSLNAAQSSEEDDRNEEIDFEDDDEELDADDGDAVEEQAQQ